MNSVQVTPGKAHVIHWGVFSSTTFSDMTDIIILIKLCLRQTMLHSLGNTVKLGCMPVFFFLFVLLPPLANHVSYDTNSYSFISWHTHNLPKNKQLWYPVILNLSLKRYCSSPKPEFPIIIYLMPSCFSKPVWLLLFHGTQQMMFWKMLWCFCPHKRSMGSKIV